MPEISLFYGIRVTINYNDHMPPHFHAKYSEFSICVDLRDISVLNGYFPRKQTRMILLWAEMHKDELLQDWELALDNKPLNRIKGL